MGPDSNAPAGGEGRAGAEKDNLCTLKVPPPLSRARRTALRLTSEGLNVLIAMSNVMLIGATQTGAPSTWPTSAAVSMADGC